MSKHSTFTLERHYDAPVERVYACWANPELKSRWFGNLEGVHTVGHKLDFRPGGTEHARSQCGKPEWSTYNATYHVTDENERIVYSYSMDLEDKRMSVSLATIEFAAEGKGCKMTLTEQGVFLDDFGWSDGREEGTRLLLEAIAKDLARQEAHA